MKSQISSLVCLLAVIAAASSPAVEARPKRSVVYAAPVVASLPVVHSHVVHANPTSVVSFARRCEHVRFATTTNQAATNPLTRMSAPHSKFDTKTTGPD